MTHFLLLWIVPHEYLKDFNLYPKSHLASLDNLMWIVGLRGGVVAIPGVSGFVRLYRLE